jgi:hypothetical protein
MTPETLREWLQEAKSNACGSFVSSLFHSRTKKFCITGIKLSESEISWLKDKLSDERAVHLRSDAPTLCSILLLDYTASSKRIFVNFESLEGNIDMLLHAWLGGHWEWLIVLCDSTVQPDYISKTYLIIHRRIKVVPPNKYLIILTARSVQQITDFVPIEHEFKFEQLSDESKKIVLDKEIDFQGCKVTMGSVLERHGNMQHVLGPELVTDLITEETTVNIGGSLQENEGYYAPRILERKLWLQTDLLRNANDIIFVSGTTDEELLKTLSSGKTVESVSLEDINMRDFTQNMSTNIFFAIRRRYEKNFPRHRGETPRKDFALG